MNLNRVVQCCSIILLLFIQSVISNNNTCPLGNNQLVCSGNGVCNEVTKFCSCNLFYTIEKDCSISFAEANFSNAYNAWKIFMIVIMIPIYIYCWLVVAFRVRHKLFNLKMLLDLIFLGILFGITFGILYVAIDPQGFKGILAVWVQEIFYSLFVLGIITSWALVINYWISLNAFMENSSNIVKPGPFNNYYKLTIPYVLMYAFSIFYIFCRGFNYGTDWVPVLYSIAIAVDLLLCGSYCIYYGIQLKKKSKKISMNETAKKAFYPKVVKLVLTCGIGCYSFVLFAFIMDFTGYRFQPSGFLVWNFVENGLLLVAAFIISCLMGEYSFKYLLTPENWKPKQNPNRRSNIV